MYKIYTPSKGRGDSFLILNIGFRWGGDTILRHPVPIKPKPNRHFRIIG